MKQFSERLHIFDTPVLYQGLLGIRRGFEKENLRVDAAGWLSDKPHPQALGSSLTHPFITTDYSEALLELITEPSENITALFQQLKELHQVVYGGIGDELLWASSMPCHIPPDDQIPIAVYGNSNIGKLKHLYRVGLGNRYGRSMQTIAGIHYNFSLPRHFWEQYHGVFSESKNKACSEPLLSAFISEQYLGMIRNIFRYGWFLSLLFGASPSLSRSFFNKQKTIPDFLKIFDVDSETLIAPYATSLRLSDFGYQNKSQMDLFVSYNSLPAFLKTMNDAIHTPDPEYRRMGVVENGQYKQLSDGILQIEDEHYALVRPKCVVGLGERRLHALRDKGIEYLEVRALDIHPFLPLGIDEATVHVLDTFLIMCLIEESPPLMPAEMRAISDNHHRVVQSGRASAEVLEKAKHLNVKMQSVACILDKAYNQNQYEEACLGVSKQLEEPETLTSARVLADMRAHQESYFDFVMRWSRQHKKGMSQTRLSPERLDFYVQLAENSHREQTILEQEASVPFEEYLRRLYV